jgi:hypothetical protein
MNLVVDCGVCPGSFVTSLEEIHYWLEYKSFGLTPRVGRDMNQGMHCHGSKLCPPHLNLTIPGGALVPLLPSIQAKRITFMSTSFSKESNSYSENIKQAKGNECSHYKSAWFLFTLSCLGMFWVHVMHVMNTLGV